jgi:hypothetical protein
MTNKAPKLTGLLVYGAGAAAAANWLDYAFFQAPPPYPPILYAALAGSILLGSAGFVSLFSSRYGIILGALGLCFSWPYFGWLSMNLPWRSLSWLMRVHYRGMDQLAAIFFLLFGTLYSIMMARLCLTAAEMSFTR